MKFLTQLTRILLLYFGCEALGRFWELPVPGALLGMVVLVACLGLGVVKTEQIEEICDFFLRDMTLFFIPPAVGILAGYHHLRGDVPAFLFIATVTTVLVFATTAFVTSVLIKRAETAAARIRT